MEQNLHIVELDDSVEIRVIARPGSKSNGLIGIHDSALKISVTAAPDKGKANKSIINLLASLFGLPSSSVTVEAGDTSRRKKVKIRGISKMDVLKKVEAELN